MLSSNNVIYGFQVTYAGENEETVIDSNKLANELIGREEQLYKGKLLAQERERRLAEMRESGVEIPEGIDPDEFLGLADSIAQSEAEEEAPEVDIDYVAEAMAEAERIVAQAKEQADSIIAAAEVDAQAIKNLASQDGKKEGYNEGTQQAALELMEAKKSMQAELDQMHEEYMNAAMTLEHEIVEMCIPVFEKVFNAELSGRREVIYHLLDHCIMNIERSKQMQIKVSESNADFIKSKKDELQARVGSDVNFDIIVDSYLDDNQCIIETDGGIFDCGIDTELDALLRDIKALS